jgi:hypothetical protein
MKKILMVVAVAACGPSVSNGDIDGRINNGGADSGGSVYADAAPIPDVDTTGSQAGCTGVTNCYTVFAHSNDTLYLVDLMAKTLTTVGNFNAKVGSSTDTITDLAVLPGGDVYAISKQYLYKVDPTTGQTSNQTMVGTCGSDNVALTATPDGSLYAGDYTGKFCKIDTTTSPAMATPIGTGIGMGMALSGDIVTVDDGTMFGTALYTADESAGTGSVLSNLLVTIDPTTGLVNNVIGATGYPKLYGVGYALGQVFGFTHDGTGRVITIDITTGAGTLYATFKDSSNKGISFAGAAVNPMVPKIIN